jgi:hypothetical protein
MKEAFDLDISHTEPQDRQFVQPTPDLWGEGQQAGQPVKLPVQTIPVTF